MVKVLDREAINRMVGRRGSGGVGGGGGGSDIDMAGYATQLWTDENYVGKEFFSSLFKAYDANGNEVLPNDTTTTIDNIKAMFGFWTEFYVSALGTGGQSTVGLRLAQLADVNVAGVQNDQVLKYDATSQKWVPGTASSGTDMATVWANLAAVDATKQIDYSHLSEAISLSQGAITIGSASITPLTSSDITDMATKTWVGNNYLKLTGGTLTGPLTVNNSTDAWGVHGYSVYNNEFSSAFLSYRGYGAWFGVSSNDSNHYILNVRKHIVSDGSGGDVVIYARADGCVGICTESPSCTLDIYGVSKSVYMLFKNYNDDGNAGYVGRGSSSDNTVYLCGYSGNGLGLGANNSSTDLYIDTNHNVGIGTTSISYKLHVNGTIGTGNLYAAGYVTALSDERKKDVVGEVNLTVEQIAKARTVLFRWKDKRDNDLHMGCIAQDWQALTPQLVHDRNDELSMEYSVIAAIGTVKNSRRLVNHETRLRRLEKMFALNENDLED